MRRTAMIGLASLTLALTATSASAVPGYVKRACTGDYFAFCSQYSPGTPAVRKCFRRNGKKLSSVCRGALVQAGLAPRKKKYRRRYKRRLAGR